MKVPDRFRQLPPRHFTGAHAITIACPECGAKPHCACIHWAKDANGQPYERGKMKTLHSARKLAWRTIREQGA